MATTIRRDDSGDHGPGQQRQTEEQMQSQRATDDLGQVGGHRHQLGLDPVGDPGPPGKSVPQGGR
jgi:hypothetical protein